ncbi:MAG: hypothetical protein H6625_00145 [Bdellovibrionaceae bacterium]|nr:hypothetical protein [Pseudobdellovibrionaceae bacterium]
MLLRTLGIIYFIFIYSPSLFGQSVQSTFFNIEGQLMDSSDVPVTSSNVNFLVGVYNPAGNCLLYEEEIYNQDLSGTNGIFNLAVGTLTANKSSNDPGLNYVEIFENLNSKVVPSCGTYSPALGDHRTIKITVNGDVLPDIPLGSVPSALVAESLQGLLPSHFLQVNPAQSLTQANLESLTNNSNASSLHHHDSHNDSRYVKLGSIGAQNLGSGNVGIGTATPGANLEILANDPVLRFNDSSTAAGGSKIEFMDNGVNKAKIEATSDAHLKLYTNNSMLALEIHENQDVEIPGNLLVGTDLSVDGQIQTGNDQPIVFRNSITPNSVRLRAPSGLSNDYTLTWPNIAPTSGQILQSNGTGNLSWVLPGGAANATQIQGVNVSVNTLSNNNVLVFDGTDWINSAPPSTFENGLTINTGTLDVNGPTTFDNTVVHSSTLTMDANNPILLKNIGTGEVYLRAAGGGAGITSFSFPPNSGSLNNILITDGSGNTNWVDPNTVFNAANFVTLSGIESITGAKTFSSTTQFNDLINVSKSNGIASELLNVNLNGPASDNLVEFSATSGSNVVSSILKVEGKGDAGTMLIHRLNSGTILELKDNFSSKFIMKTISSEPFMGIGTNNPLATLHVNSNTQDVAIFESTHNTPTIFLKKIGGSSVSVSTNSNADLILNSPSTVSVTADLEMNGKAIRGLASTVDGDSGDTATSKDYVDKKTKTIFAHYKKISSQNLNTASNFVDFETLINNIDSLVSATPWTFTVPSGGDGIYQINVSLAVNKSASTELVLYVNHGGIASSLDYSSPSLSSGVYKMGGSISVSLIAGNTVHIELNKISGSANIHTTYPFSDMNWVTVQRVTVTP